MATGSQRAQAQTFSRAQLRSKANSLLSSTALIPVAGALAFAPTQAMAETVVWDGETSTNAATATNWSGDILPSTNGTVILDNGALPNQPRINSNTTYGVTEVSAGTLTVDSILTSPTINISGTGVLNFVSGNIFGAINVADGGTLLVEDRLGTGASITLNGAGRNGQGALRGTGLFSSVEGPILLESDSRIEAVFGTQLRGIISGDGRTLTFGGSGGVSIQSGSIRTGSGSVIKEGTGTLGLFGVNTYTGDTIIRSGSLQTQGGSALSDTGRLFLETGTNTQIAEGVETIGSLEGGGRIFLQRVSVSSGGLLVGDSTSTTFSGQIVQFGGEGTITKRGTGTLTLTGASDYAGLTTVSEGTLRVGSATALGSTAAGTTVEDGAAVEIDGTFNLSESFTIAGNGVANGGALRFVSGDATLLGSITLAANARINSDSTGAPIISSPITGINRNLTFGGTGNLAVSGEINLGAGVLTKDGSGTLTLSGTLDTATSLLVGGGTLNLDADQRVASVALLSGSITGTGRLTSDSDFDVRSGVISAVLEGSVGLNKTTAGTVTLSGANTYADQTRVSAGTLRIANASALGTTAAGTTVQTGATVEIDGSFAIAEAFSIAGNGVSDGGAIRFVAGAASLNGAITLTADARINTVSLGDNTGFPPFITGAITGTDRNLALGGSGILSITGAINLGNGTLTKDGTSQIALAGSNTVGAVMVNGGILQLSGGQAVSDAALVTLGTGGQLLVDASETIGALNGGGVVSLQIGQELTTGGNNTSTTYSGRLQGLGGLVKNGTGTFTLTGSNSYFGSTTINAGTLRIGDGGASGTIGLGAITIEAGGTLDFNRSTGLGISNFLSGTGTLRHSGTGTTTLQGDSDFAGTVVVTAGQLRFGRSFGGAVTVNGGRLGGTGTLSGAVTINNGGTLAAGFSPGTLTVGSLTLNAGSITEFELGEAGVAGGANNDLIRVTGNLALNGGAINIIRGLGFGAGAYTLFEFGTLSGALGNLSLTPLDGNFVGTLALDGSTVVLNAAPAEDLIFWNGSTLAPTGAVVGGSGTWNFTNTNFTEDDGDFSGVWEGNGFNAVFTGTGGTVTIAADTTVAPSGLAFLVDGYTIEGGNAASRLELTAATGIDTAPAVGATINAVISGGGSLTKTGDGTLTLGGVNTYTGDTFVVGGTLVNSGTIAGLVRNFATLTSTGTLSSELINNAGATANLAGSAAALSNSGTLNVTGNLNAVGDLNNFPSGTVTVAMGANASITGTVSNQGTAANAFTINGSLSATGQFLNQFGGNLLIGAGGTLSATGGVVNGGGATLVNNGTIASAVLTTGSFTSTGTLQAGLELGAISASAELQGTVMGTVINPGTINLTGITTGISLLELGGLGAFNLNGFNTSLGNLTGSGTVNLGAGTLTVGGANTSATFGGAINGTGGLVKTGTGTFTLTGVHGYTGETRVDEGTLSLAASGVIAGRVRNSGTFTNSGTVNGGVTNLASVTSTGTINGGLTQFAGATATVSGTLNGFVNTGGTLIVNGDLVSDNFGQITGTGRVEVQSGARWSGLLGFTNLSTDSSGLLIGGTLDVNGIFVTQTGATTSIGGGATLIAVNSSNLGSVFNTGTVNTDVTNSGEIFNLGTWNGILSQGTGSVTNNGTWNGNFLLDAGGLIINRGTWDTTSPFGSSLRDGNFSNFGTLTGRGFLVTGANALLANDTTGTITLDAGQAFTIDGGGRIENFGTVSAGAQVNAGGILQSFAGASWTGAINNAASGTVSNAGTITGNITNAGAFASVGTVNGNLTNNAGGTVRLDGVFDGNITNSAQIILLGTTTGIDRIEQSAGGVFNLAGFDTTIGGLSGVGQVMIGGGDLTVTTIGGSTSFGGTISGSGSLIKTGAGTFSLTGANTFAGNVVVDGGVFFLGTAGSLFSGVDNNATFINNGFVAGLTTNNATLFSEGQLNAGLLNNAGATATLANIVGGTIDNFGAITLGGSLTGGAAMVQSAGGTFDLAGFNAALGSLAGSGLVSLGFGDLTVGSTGMSTTFDGVISGTGSLIKVGVGNFTLTGVSSAYTGETFVDAGALTLAAGGVLGGRVNNSATFTNAGTVSGLVINTGEFTSTGTVLGGLNQASGTATVSGTLNGTITTAGTLIVNGDPASDGFLTNTGTGLVQVQSGARWSGLAGIDNASTNATGILIAGDLETSGIVVNRAGANLTVSVGASLAAANMANLGTVTNQGTLTSDVTNSGSIQNDLVWNGTLSQGTGSARNSGSWTGAFLIDAGGLVTNIGRWDNNTGFLSAVNNGLFENFGLLQGGGINVTGADARLANRAGGTITISPGQALRVDNDGIISNAGLITGAGEANAGGVILNLAGASWNGPLSVAATGTLTNTGTITGEVVNNGTFVSTDTLNGTLFNQAGANASLSGNVIGDILNSGFVALVGTTNGIGTFVQSATGAFDLSGFDTTIGGLSGAGQVLLRDGDLTVRTSGRSTTFAGVISGSGGLIKTGEAGLFLDGANDFTGLTTVNQGSLVVGLTGSLAGSVRNNANLINGGTIGGSVTNFGTFLNANRVLGSLTNNGSVQLAGQIDGAVLNNGSITNISGAVVLGRFTQGEERSLNLAGFNSSFGSLAGTGTIALGSAFLTVGGDNTSSTFAGVIDGSGGLVKVGSGTFTVTGVNTYSGTTFVNAGTLVIGDGAVVAPPASTSATAAAPVVASAAPAAAPAPLGLALLGGSELSDGRITVSLAGPNVSEPVSTAAPIAEAAGEAPAQAPLVAAMNTTLASAVIAGSVVNSATVINNGTILGQLINNAGASATNHGVIGGTVLNNGALVSTGTLGGGLMNNGTALIQGVLDGDVLNTGTITLTGATTGIDIFEQTATGVLNLAGFNTTIGAITGAGSIALGNATLSTGTNGITTQFGGVISGTGVLNKIGTGRLILTGANTYTGGTTIAAGVLQLGDGGTTGSIVGPVVNNGALVINRSDAVTLAGAITGSGMFVQDGTGTTTLTGANTYAGGTLVSRGRLVGTTTSLQGQIQNDAELEFAQTAMGTFGGQLFGTGLFLKTGAGLLELTGNNNGFVGSTEVRAGELRVMGGLANSFVTLSSGTTLSGTGTVGGVTATSGSIIAPGANGVGTLGVNGTLTMLAGSTLQLQIRAGAASDAVAVTGDAALGGTVAFTNLGGVYAFNSEVLLLQASAGRGGTFAATTGFGSFGILYRPELVYSANQVRLRFAPNLLANIVGNAALTANQRAVVNRIDGAVTAGYNPQPLFNIYSLPTAELVAAFDQISGEVYATAAGVGIEQERLVREAVLGRLNAVAAAARETPEAGKGAGAWAQVFGGWGDGNGDGNASAFDADRSGFATGIDFGSANDEGSWRAGVFGTVIQSDVTVDRLGSRAEVEQTGGGIYASISSGGFSAILGGYLTSVDLTATRTIALPGFAETNRGETGGDGRQAFAEVSYTIPAGKGMIRPFLGGTIGSFDLDALTETGGAAALDMREQSYSTGTVIGGVEGLVPVGKRLTLFGTLAGRAQLGDRDPQAQLALAASPAQAFGVSGVQLDDVALSARLDASLKLGKNVDIAVGYTGLIGSTVTDHGARATLQVQF